VPEYRPSEQESVVWDVNEVVVAGKWDARSVGCGPRFATASKPRPNEINTKAHAIIAWAFFAYGRVSDLKL
jgi:thiamine monophosphate synthase